MKTTPINIYQLTESDYTTVWQKMKQFTDDRQADTLDEIWLVEHTPVFTQGANGKKEHLLNPGDIPVIQVDRGGQVTYHGPGQLVVYFMIDMRRKGMNIRELVSRLEQVIIDYLAFYQIKAYAKRDAPGIYVDDKKICSIGLRIRRGCSYHGIAFNINLDLEPFSRINPCGFQGLQMTKLAILGGPDSVKVVANQLIPYFFETFKRNKPCKMTPLKNNVRLRNSHAFRLKSNPAQLYCLNRIGFGCAYPPTHLSLISKRNYVKII